MKNAGSDTEKNERDALIKRIRGEIWAINESIFYYQDIVDRRPWRERDENDSTVIKIKKLEAERAALYDAWRAIEEDAKQ